jgi:hypothetical protein
MLKDSQLLKDLADGKLPEVRVGIENIAIVKMVIALLIVAAFIILIIKITK